MYSEKLHSQIHCEVTRVSRSPPALKVTCTHDLLLGEFNAGEKVSCLLVPKVYVVAEEEDEDQLADVFLFLIAIQSVPCVCACACACVCVCVCVCACACVCV